MTILGPNAEEEKLEASDQKMDEGKNQSKSFIEELFWDFSPKNRDYI